MKRYLWFLAVLSLFFFPAHPAALAEGLPDGSSVSNLASTGKVSLTLRGIDVVEALKVLSDRGNFNMVIGGNIQGRVTLFLKDVDIQDALEIVLVSSGLAYEKKGEILYVMTQRDYEQIYGESFIEKRDARVIQLKYAKAASIAKSLEQAKTRMGKVIVDDASNSLVLMDSPATLVRMEKIVESLDQEVTSRIFELKYAKAEDMKIKVSEMLTKDVGVMEIDARTNKISVTDIRSRLDQIGKMVHAFDERPKQVLIEAKIVQVTLNDEYKLGVDWQNVFTSLQNKVNLRSNFQLASQGTFPTGFTSGAEAVIGTFGGTNYAMLIQALKKVGDTNLLSSPRITALNNQEAKILVGESRPYATNTVVTPAAGATTTASTLSFLDIGIKLFVTPSISDDGFITMKIKPEVSSSSTNYTYGSPPTTVPIISTTQAETSVRVKDSNTIIIAGLIKDERVRNVNKIPIAGDLPLFGNLFRKTDKSIAKQELVIFITPHIISGENNYVDVPVTPPVNEERFTVPEAHLFERRGPNALDPTYFKKNGNTERIIKDNITTFSVPASMQEYYYTVKNTISNHTDFSKVHAGIAKGNIQISFRLSSTGELADGPFVRHTSNPNLVQPALDAVKASAPFQPFPESIHQKEKELVMDFIFE